MCTWIRLEVRLPVLLIVLVCPEVDRHGRVRARAHELAGHAGVFDVLAVRVEDLHVHAQGLSLNLCDRR